MTYRGVCCLFLLLLGLPHWAVVLSETKLKTVYSPIPDVSVLRTPNGHDVTIQWWAEMMGGQHMEGDQHHDLL
jgi:hypothetical protein